jgi:putative ABC transport system permease protein
LPGYCRQLSRRVFSRIEPVRIFKGTFKVGGKNFLTQALVVFQFGLSILLIAGTLGMSRQLNFLLSKDLGFNPAQIVAIETWTGFDYDKANALVERFRTRAINNPNVISVSGMNGAFLGYDRRAFQYQGESKSSYIVRGDEELLRTLGIELKEGRNFTKERSDDKTTGVIVNETFLRMMGWSEPAVGKRLSGVNDPNYEGLEVIGVVKDFHFLPLQQRCNRCSFSNMITGVLTKSSYGSHPRIFLRQWSSCKASGKKLLPASCSNINFSMRRYDLGIRRT